MSRSSAAFFLCISKSNSPGGRSAGTILRKPQHPLPLVVQALSLLSPMRRSGCVKGQNDMHFANADAAAQAGTNAEKEDVAKGRNHGEWTYLCAQCCAQNQNMTQEEAVRCTRGERSGHSIKRREAYTNAQAQVLQVWLSPLVDTANGSTPASTSISAPRLRQNITINLYIYLRHLVR